MHTHVTATDVSIGDYEYQIGFDNMDSIVAVRPDGRIAVIQGNAISKEYPINYIEFFEKAINKGMDKEHAEYYARDKIMLENGLGVIKYG